MTKPKKNKKSKKKGFTLVELLAVIIILAIVVGITIPAVLTTTNKTKEKAFKTAAQSVANWVDRQYEVYSKGLSDYEVATLDSEFEKLCVRTCGTNGYADYGGSDSDLGGKNNCSCDARVNLITNNFLTAAGLNYNNIKIGTIGTGNYQSIRIVDGIWRRGKATTTTLGTILQYEDESDEVKAYKKTRVYINKETGKSCVTLIASEDGDYPANSVVCGGSCQNSDATKPDYCKPTL